MTRRFSLLFVCLTALLPQAFSQGQVLKGKITSNTGDTIPHAVIYIRELAQGTSANDRGVYSINLANGTYHCVFQSMGYETKEQTVTMIDGSQTLDVTLVEKPYMLTMVTVGTGKDEDPAYAIMRKAIGMAPFYLNQVSESKSKVYLKGTMQVTKIAGIVKALAKDEIRETGVKEGETYFQESVNEVTFVAPDKYSQKILSISSTFPKGMSDMYFRHIGFNIYDANIGMFISPLSPEAFSHYKFTYEGCSLDGSRLVNKIKITPKIKNQMTVSGYIYIADDFWNVHEFDFYGELLGVKYHNKQSYAEVRPNIFLPINYLLDFDISVMGNKGTINYRSVVKYSTVTVNPNAKKLAEDERKKGMNAIVPDTQNAKQKKLAAKIEALLSKDKLSNRDAMELAKLMKQATDEARKEQQTPEEKKKDPLLIESTFKFEVDSLARKRDTTYWVEARPIPLSEVEIKSYARRDSILLIETKQDSVAKRKPITLGGLAAGKTYYLGDSSAYITHKGLLDAFALYFHPADGYSYGQNVTFSKRFKDTTSFTASLNGRYAFGRKALMGSLKLNYAYLPERRALLELEVGRKSSDYERLNELSMLNNTYSSLFAHRSYISLYDRSFVSLYNAIDIAHGLRLLANATFYEHKPLDNVTNQSFFYRRRAFRSNTPNNIHVLQDPDIVGYHKSSVLEVSLSYTPELYYRKDGRAKRMVRSKYPTVGIAWKKGFSNVFGSTSDFDLGAVSIRQNISMGVFQSLSYKAVAGMFFNKEQVYFADFKHFDNQRSSFQFGSFDNIFQLQQPYLTSTNDWYLSANATYKTMYLALKYLPFLSNTLMVEGLHVNFAKVPHLQPQTELGYSLSGIGFVGSVGVFAGFDKLTYREFRIKLCLLLAPNSR